MRILKVTLGAIAAVTIAGSALAADMAIKAPPPPAPVWSWTGFYIGANGGWGWANSNITATTFQSTVTAIPVIPNQNFSQNLDGAVFGAHLGYMASWAKLADWRRR